MADLTGLIFFWLLVGVLVVILVRVVNQHKERVRTLEHQERMRLIETGQGSVEREVAQEAAERERYRALGAIGVSAIIVLPSAATLVSLYLFVEARKQATENTLLFAILWVVTGGLTVGITTACIRGLLRPRTTMHTPDGMIRRDRDDRHIDNPGAQQPPATETIQKKPSF